MSSESVSWDSFLPAIDRIIALDIYSTEGITALFIGAICLLFLLFVFVLGGIYWRYLLRVNFYIKNLKDVNEDNLLDKKYLLLKKEQDNMSASWANRHVGQSLWKEFDETLITYEGRLYNNLDAEQFFNGSTLARRIVDSRLFPTGAAILTGVGVLGTFLGLQLGLSGLSLDGDISMIQGEIKLLAQSASVAFVTSVWGVGSSLLLNSIEKIFHGAITRKIHELQQRVDDIFPRFPVMEVFADIRSENKKSSEALNGLAEQIGNKMQTSLDSFSNEMTGSIAQSISSAAESISQTIGGTLKETIEETLVPAVQSMADVTTELADRQAKGSEEAMSGLLERFMDAMGKEGQGQRDAMQGASQEIRDAMTGLNSSMGDFFESLKQQQAAFSEEQDERAKTLEKSVHDLVAHQSSALEDTNSKLSGMLEAFAMTLGEEQARQADSLSSASGDVREAIVDLSTGMNSFFEELGSQQRTMIAEQDERTRALEAAVQRMMNGQSDAQRENSDAVSQMLHDFLLRMDQAQNKQSGSLDKASDGVRDVLTNMGGTLESFMESLDIVQERMRDEQDERNKGLEQLVHETTDSVAGLLKQGEQLQQNLDSSATAMDSVVGRMNKTGDALSDATMNLKVLGSEIGSSTTRAASSIEESVSVVKGLFAENNKVASGLEATLRSLEDIRGTVEAATADLQVAVTESSNGFSSLSTHYKDIQAAMETHVSDLEDQVSSLLSGYSDAVQAQLESRMTKWDSQTENFCTHMTSAVTAMGEVIESMDNRPVRS